MGLTGVESGGRGRTAVSGILAVSVPLSVQLFVVVCMSYLY